MNGTSRAAWVFALTFGLVAGCGDDTGTDPFADITGSYISTTFTFTPTGGSPQDILAGGGLMSIVLRSDGTTTGTLEVPAGIWGESVNESMEGTWVETEDRVEFEQPADTFVPDATWIVGDGTLTGSYTRADGTVEITLTAMQPD